MTEPRHPLFGQTLKLLSLRCSRGPAFIAVALSDGRRRLLRRAATDLERPLALPVTLPFISARTLLPLARHIRSKLTSSSEEACHANALLPSGARPPAAANIIPTVAPKALACAAGRDTEATGAADRPSPSARSGRGGTSC